MDPTRIPYEEQTRVIVEKRVAAAKVTIVRAKVRISKDDVKKLMKYTDKVGMTAVLAVRFSRERWRFWDNDSDAILDSSLQELESSKKNLIDSGFNDKSARASK